MKKLSIMRKPCLKLLAIVLIDFKSYSCRYYLKQGSWFVCSNFYSLKKCLKIRITTFKH